MTNLKQCKPRISEWSKEHQGPGRRRDPRLYFHDGDTPINEQASGLPALAYANGLLRRKEIGPIIVKDLSMGGASFIASTRFQIPDKIWLSMPNCPMLSCDVLHRRLINVRLCLYGVRWFDCPADLLESVIALWQEDQAPD